MCHNKSLKPLWMCKNKNKKALWINHSAETRRVSHGGLKILTFLFSSSSFFLFVVVVVFVLAALLWAHCVKLEVEGGSVIREHGEWELLLNSGGGGGEGWREEWRQIKSQQGNRSTALRNSDLSLGHKASGQSAEDQSFTSSFLFFILAQRDTACPKCSTTSSPRWVWSLE